MVNDPVTFYGFTAVPRDPDFLFKDHPTASGPKPKQDPFTVTDFPLPHSELVRKVREFVKAALTEQTYNHSHRVYVYGTALKRTHFPEWKYDDETYYLACLLHDIGTADRFLTTTKLSFEFKGAIVARDLILSLHGPEDQADSVCDAIVRHQDIFVQGGNITVIGQVLQLATILDNVGISVVASYPRDGWSECFAKVIETELRLKPWCHTSTFEVPDYKPGEPSRFATDVRGNEVMRQYD
ncbi:cyanamide hydratase [Multifurca ochricompacta]|uniref:Cyanamide hydratase n=1 Tax=Multifurca ochricompacta TaxID=376703 RepID=A0AAD4M4T5_9AGAM|nr:cyanamide hydratase [Multifurca ochricompacta]